MNDLSSKQLIEMLEDKRRFYILMTQAIESCILDVHQLADAGYHGDLKNPKIEVDPLSENAKLHIKDYIGNKFGANPPPGMISGGGDGIDITKVEWK